MSDSAVGVVGSAAVADRLRAAGVSVVAGTVADVPATDRVVAVGRDALKAVAVADGDPLVVPVDAGRGVRSVAPEAVPSAVETPEPHVEHHPVLDVTAASEAVGSAVFDVTVVTDEAARISAYDVESPTDSVGAFRADGVVVATAAGTPDYARRIGGPVISPAATTGVVAPIAPFQTNPDHWVLSLSGLSITVTRDEATVALFVDGDRMATVDREESVTLSPGGTVRVAVVEASRSRFA